MPLGAPSGKIQCSIYVITKVNCVPCWQRFGFISGQSTPTPHITPPPIHSSPSRPPLFAPQLHPCSPELIIHYLSISLQTTTILLICSFLFLSLHIIPIIALRLAVLLFFSQFGCALERRCSLIKIIEPLVFWPFLPHYLQSQLWLKAHKGSCRLTFPSSFVKLNVDHACNSFIPFILPSEVG